MFNTPILLITFNRPELTRRVLEVIIKQRPADLYVFQDGVRPNNPDDDQSCEEVRAVVSELTRDTDTCLHTFYSDENFGCGPGPVKAITWFFNNVQNGIIMEDDCLPDPSMFSFYQFLLDKYENDDTVSMITATNVFKKWKSYRSSYFFATNGASPMGCWAGWSKYWKEFDYTISSWKNESTKKQLNLYFDRKEYYDFYSTLYDDISSSLQNHMWDYQWAFARYLAGSKTIVASQNLVSNIGFTNKATHSSDSGHRFANLPTFPLKKMVVPSRESIDKSFNYLYFFSNNYKHKKTLFIKIKLRILRYLFAR